MYKIVTAVALLCILLFHDAECVIPIDQEEIRSMCEHFSGKNNL